MKRYIIVILVFLILLGILFITFSENRKLKKALIIDNNNLSSKNIAYQLTIEQLNYFNDSIINKLDSIRKDLKIKDNNIKQLQYILSEASKKDTIIFSDTIFIDNNLNTDTTLGDKWYTLNLELKYPNIIIAEPTFISEKCIVSSYRKETINPPKKCKFLRMFQKKHKVIEVEVIDNNPYIINEKQKFIEIIK